MYSQKLKHRLEIELLFSQLSTLKYPSLQQIKILCKGLHANTLMYIHISSLQNKSQVAKTMFMSESAWGSSKPLYFPPSTLTLFCSQGKGPGGALRWGKGNHIWHVILWEVEDATIGYHLGQMFSRHRHPKHARTCCPMSSCPARTQGHESPEVNCRDRACQGKHTCFPAVQLLSLFFI